MKKICWAIVGIIFLSSCTTENGNEKSKISAVPIIGTWKLLSGMIIDGEDSTFTDYTKNQETIKIINESHFAFLRHDLTNDKDSISVFVAGGGKYSLNGNKYTEYLEYCNYREWENNQFEFELKIDGDTLITRGVEKVEKLNVNHLNIETYIRVNE